MLLETKGFSMRRFLAIFLFASAIWPLSAHADCSRYERILMTNWMKDVIKKDLKDPRSARFSDIQVVDKSTGRCKAEITGVVRAKNSYGAFEALRFVAETSIVEKDRPAVHDVRFF